MGSLIKLYVNVELKYVDIVLCFGNRRITSASFKEWLFNDFFNNHKKFIQATIKEVTLRKEIKAQKTLLALKDTLEDGQRGSEAALGVCWKGNFDWSSKRVIV